MFISPHSDTDWNSLERLCSPSPWVGIFTSTVSNITKLFCTHQQQYKGMVITTNTKPYICPGFPQQSPVTDNRYVVQISWSKYSILQISVPDYLTFWWVLESFSAVPIVDRTSRLWGRGVCIEHSLNVRQQAWVWHRSHADLSSTWPCLTTAVFRWCRAAWCWSSDCNHPITQKYWSVRANQMEDISVLN